MKTWQLLILFVSIVVWVAQSPLQVYRALRISAAARNGYQEVTVERQMFPDITLLEDVCPAEGSFPPEHGRVFDHRADVRSHYEQQVGDKMRLFNNYIPGVDTDVPYLKVIQNGKFIVWNGNFTNGRYAFKSEASAWNDKGDVAIGLGYVPPKNTSIITTRKLPPGNYVAFTTWFHENYGHFVHDHLPTIAFLKTVVPESTKFLLVDAKITRKVLSVLDPHFLETRVMWIHSLDAVEVTGGGTLTVAVGNSLPANNGCCRLFDFLRQWMAATHPDRHRDEQRSIIYYSRTASSDVYHGRILDEEHEKDVIRHIRAKMQQYNRPERLVTFTGQWNGETMDVLNQFATFRTASTIIGPHGSGIGGNFVWTLPFADKCQDRVQLLEFIPGPDSAYVQALYASYYVNWRKWPLDYNVVLYTNQSTPMTTFIDLNALDSALDYMWGGPFGKKFVTSSTSRG